MFLGRLQISRPFGNATDVEQLGRYSARLVNFVGNGWAKIICLTVNVVSYYSTV
jgi:hypothetical protein